MTEKSEQPFEIVDEGRKTFFITPDSALLPEEYLEDYLKHGYESYIITDDRSCPLKQKIEFIIDHFKDSILFFYIDSVIKDIDWPYYIRELQEKYGNRVMFGVLYAKRQNQEEQSRLEKYYLYDLGLPGGCIGLDIQQTNNFALVDTIMFANQANGRRKTIRAICDSNSELVFERNELKYKAQICDVSLNHFSCIFTSYPHPIQMYEKVENILIQVNGLHFSTDAVLLMQRQTEAGMLNIFMFTRKDGAQGLEFETSKKLSQKIYHMVTDKSKSALQDMFAKVGKQLEKETVKKSGKKSVKETPKTTGNSAEK